MSNLDGLSKREREILRIVFSLGNASAREIHAALADGTSYSAVRAFLAILESKGRVAHRAEGQKYLWSPTVDGEKEGTSQMADAVRTFFKGSKARAIAALIDSDSRPLSEDECARLQALIESAKDKRL
jgi:Predicted transcriptional regulator